METLIKSGKQYFPCYTKNIYQHVVIIKWNGKTVENIKASEGQQISELKRIIEDNCGVPAKKQKLLFKGKMLKV